MALDWDLTRLGMLQHDFASSVVGKKGQNIEFCMEQNVFKGM